MQREVKQPEPIYRVATVLFWVAFYGLGILVLILTLQSIGMTSPVAIFLQAAIVVWISTLALHLLRKKGRYATAAMWVMMLAVPLSFQIVRRAHYWITIGMEEPDGMGSPMAFLLGFILEWVLFAPLCFMFTVLLVLRPWSGKHHASDV